MSLLGNFKNEIGTWISKRNPLLTREQQQARWAICQSCNRLTNHSFCEECHCYMRAKTWLATASCPIRKWLPVHDVAWFFDDDKNVASLLRDASAWTSTQVDSVAFIRSILLNLRALGAQDWKEGNATLDTVPGLVKIYEPGMQPCPPIIGDILMSPEGKLAMFTGLEAVWTISDKGEVVTLKVNEFHFKAVYRVLIQNK